MDGTMDEWMKRRKDGCIERRLDGMRADDDSEKKKKASVRIKKQLMGHVAFFVLFLSSVRPSVSVTKCVSVGGQSAFGPTNCGKTKKAETS